MPIIQCDAVTSAKVKECRYVNTFPSISFRAALEHRSVSVEFERETLTLSLALVSVPVQYSASATLNREEWNGCVTRDEGA